MGGLRADENDFTSGGGGIKKEEMLEGSLIKQIQNTNTNTNTNIVFVFVFVYL